MRAKGLPMPKHDQQCDCSHNFSCQNCLNAGMMISPTADGPSTKAQKFRVAVYDEKTGTTYHEFDTMNDAQEFQEHLVFNLGLDAEVE